MQRPTDFDAYLHEKGIHATAFKQDDPSTYWRLAEDFNAETNPRSFGIQKLFLINPLRRKYPLATKPLIQKNKALGT